ncbi:hypothetical protein RhiirA1_469726 [Rhizophagus irregularis]|uniref:Uncharacterized protein n=1 Tax=Rhizophagus irregularis TaxID=588596 RepID=A0A2N0R7H0_9GLOM|nr:hypothetical protein RhiirA1_469726 [Rhizophagus irregularis]
MYSRACNIFKLSQPSILDFVKVSLDIAINIQNTNGNLWKIKIRRTADNDHNIFIKCQHLVAIDIFENFSYEYANKLLNLLVDLAPLTLYRLHIDFITNFDRESLKLFFTNCKGRKTLYLYHLYNYLRENFVVKDIIELDYYDDDFWNHGITMLNDEQK